LVQTSSFDGGVCSFLEVEKAPPLPSSVGHSSPCLQTLRLEAFAMAAPKVIPYRPCTENVFQNFQTVRLEMTRMIECKPADPVWMSRGSFDIRTVFNHFPCLVDAHLPRKNTERKNCPLIRDCSCGKGTGGLRM
jgi:hypothetical protein